MPIGGAHFSGKKGALGRNLGMSRFVFNAFIRLGLGLALTTAFLAGAQPLGEPNSVDDLRTKIGKWVETRQLISKEKSDWEVEKEILQATRGLLRQQKESLQAEITEIEESNTLADEERRDLLLERGEYLRGSRALEDEIRGLEEELLALVPRLPEPLQKKLELLLVQIPKDPENTKLQLGQRLVNVLGVLAQAEKFNGTATFVGETRAVDGDQRVRVRTLYWGLGQAIYVDAQGEIAGIGRPGANGWEFSNDPELADEAKLLLDIYEGNVDVIEFVKLPVEIP
jgi:hypothetical protein